MMAEIKYYEVGDFRFEFEPEGSPYKGLLHVQYPELEPYTSKVDLGSSRSRNIFVNDAHDTCGMNVGDLKTALNSLCNRRNEEVSAAKASEKESEEECEDPEVPKEEIDQRVGKPGVLERFVEDAATFSRVVRERDQLKLIALVCSSSQLGLLPNGKPGGTNNILTAEAGRGKNYLCDAVARLVPDEFCFAFESSSAKALYYAAEKNPAFLKHRWIYPNEAEGTDLLVEMFRPLLSGGKAKHITVNKDASGGNSGQQFTIEGPVTLTIPTVRNKIDTQLQSRMLVADLPDYEGRVADHSGAVSELLSRNYAATDYSEQIRVWHAALKTLTGIRRVITPVDHKDFRFTSDSVSYGPRLWTNVLGLMCTHAWLEQRNREIVTLENGERVIVATPRDYEVAYEVFKATCERSVINLSDTHRKILDAVYALQEEAKDDPKQIGWFHSFGQRKIQDMSKTLHEKAYVRQASISENKTFLVKSAKLLWEPEGKGLALVEDADPSWWQKGDALDGFPKPEQVKIWWTVDCSPDPDPSNRSIHSPANRGDREDYGDDREVSDHENGLDKANSAIGCGVIGDIGGLATVQTSLSEGEVSSALEEKDRVRLPIPEVVQMCKDLFDSEPKWIPKNTHDDEKLYLDAIGLWWATSLLYEDNLDPDQIFEALKIIFRDDANSLGAGIEG